LCPAESPTVGNVCGHMDTELSARKPDSFGFDGTVPERASEIHDCYHQEPLSRSVPFLEKGERERFENRAYVPEVPGKWELRNGLNASGLGPVFMFHSRPFPDLGTEFPRHKAFPSLGTPLFRLSGPPEFRVLWPTRVVPGCQRLSCRGVS
jgi:hypothetical protein